MNITMPINLAAAYTSPSQKARVVTEGWARSNLFCPVCTTDRLTPTPANTRAVDFVCDNCEESFQLKGKSSSFSNKVVDGGYNAFMAALSSDSAPNLFLLQYDRVAWTVANLVLVPHFALSPSAIECRKPLSASARRAGWVGCFILLSQVPLDARIGVVLAGQPVTKESIRAQYRRLLPLKQIAPSDRGWTLDVLNTARSLGKPEFTNADMYSRVRDLEALHPENHHVKDKIRQQLQVLRDSGFLTHSGIGKWRIT